MRHPVNATWTVRTLSLWEIYYAVAFAGALVLALLMYDQSASDRLTLAALLLAMAVWYVAFGRRAVRAEFADWRGYVLLAGLLVLFVAALTIAATGSYLLFALCPLTYMAIPMRVAHAAVAVFSLTPAAMHLATTGDVRTTVAVLVPIGVVAIAMSVMMSLTISRTERQSEERAALIEQLASTRAEVARLSREAGIADERQRLAGEIHDTVAQGLSSVVMLIEAAMAAEPEQAQRHLALAARTARENLQEARAIVGALTPGQLTDSSLADAVRRVVDRFGSETGITARFSVETANAGPLVPTAVDVVLLRLVQEALANVRKHAKAHAVDVTLVRGQSTVALDVTDDGRGFDPSTPHGGYGLGGMASRVEQVGGELVVQSAPGVGTTVRTEITI